LALIRKIYLGKCLEIGDWSKIYIDFKKRPLCSINHKCSKEEILGALSKYGIYYSNSNVNIKIWGDGKPLREFLWSEDLADACIYVMNNINFKDLINIGNIKNTHLNVGTGKELSILELAQTIKSSLKFNGELVFDESKPNGTFRKLTNSSKINDLGWHPKVNIDLGIKKIIKWYAEN
jgi:GDP-L-fucose synthase